MLAFVAHKYDKQVHRFLEFILGFSTWILLLSPIWLGITYPPAIVYLLTFFTIYWSFLSFRHTIGMILGYSKYAKEMKVDWLGECKKLDFSQLPDKATLPPSLDSTYHLMLIPAVNEPEEVISGTLNGLLNQTFDSKQMVLVFTVEQKYSEGFIQRLNTLVEPVKARFKDVLVYVHPAGIAGEAIGAGAANRTWGAKHAVVDLQARGENLRYYVFSTIDADHILDKQYIARLTHLYLTSDNRDNHYYSTAVYLFNNNIWRVPPLMRIEANAVTMGALSDWLVTRRDLKDTFSAYSCSLQTLIDADYWDVTLGVDDTIFYWRAFFVRNGNFEGLPHYIPFSADAVEGKSVLDSHISLYKQLLRWGWGAIDFPLSVKEFMKNKKISRSKKILWLIKHFEKRVVLVNIIFLITFGFSVVTLVNPYVKQSNFAYSLPDMMSAILSITLVCLIPATYLRLKFCSPMPKDWNIFKRLFVFLEGPLVLINLLTYSFFPWIHAQTKIMLGKKMKDLYFTAKVR